MSASLFSPLGAEAQTFVLLHTFTGGTDGGFPATTLVHDGSGNLYGTAYQGGDLNCSAPQGCGLVFEITTSGEETVLYNFAGGTHGEFPKAGPVRTSSGTIYGTTSYPAGTVYELDQGKERVLVTFNGGNDGYQPAASIIRDEAGNLFGTTALGGDLSCSINNQVGCGEVFEVTKENKLIVLHRFSGDDGAEPAAGLVRDSAGNFYGSTSMGTTSEGTIFKIDTSGKFTVLYSFTGGADGGQPGSGTLVLDRAGNLYGTTSLGGSNNNGTVYQLTQSGKETVLYRFAGGASGSRPEGGVIRDSKGNLFGTTFFGGDLNCDSGLGCGTVYKLDAQGKLTVLYRFTGGSDGEFPTESLTFDIDGNLYGTTPGDYVSNYGSAFKVIP